MSPRSTRRGFLVVRPEWRPTTLRPAFGPDLPSTHSLEFRTNKRSRTAKQCVSNKASPGAAAARPLFKTLSLGIQTNPNTEPAKFQYTIRFPAPYFSMTKQIRIFYSA